MHKWNLENRNDMMTKLIIPVLCIMACSSITNAQISLSLNGDFEKGVLRINNANFTSQSTINDYQQVLGKPERIEKIGGTDRVFAYDKSGISLFLTPNSNIVLDVYITFIYDGDKKIAKEKFEGRLAINGTELNSQTTPEQIGKLVNAELKVAMKGLYMTKGKLLSLVVYYPESTIGQFAFGFQK